MARIPTITERTHLAPEHRPAWDAIAGPRGHVAGPFTALLHSPALAERTGHLGAYVRFESRLPATDRELAVLTVARTLDCRFEWAAHAPLARAAGVREAAIAAIRDRRAPAGLSPEEAQVADYTRQLLAAHRVDDTLFRGLHDRLGVTGLVELTGTIGYYAMLACTLNAFEITPEGSADLLPD